jgi:oligopeptide/dipeptide ABC transporter ATP-binding protein
MRSYPHELSGGMCQRVMIAIALSCDPKVLIADEPTTALDVTVQAQVLDLLQSLQTEHGMAMLFITHDLAVIADCADRVAVMYSGEIVEIGDVMTLYARPEHPYTEALLAATPHMLRQRAGGRGLADRLAIERRARSGCRFAPRCNYAVEACREATVELIPRCVSDAVRCIRASELVLSGTRSQVTLGET